MIGGGQPDDVRVATFYYPYWHAAVNGSFADVGRDENGVITIPVGAGAAQVDLRFEEPPASKALLWLSTATWFGLIVSLAYAFASAGRNFLQGRNNKTAGE
jgi:hypothetical protein